ncbi:MAG: formyltransferase family protein [Castellaniella sp.]|uniref:formyltransferase family protein n=1 Tax=Castellaniella sp. TaxID=1955812 RepID=UPI003C761179
MQLLLMADGEVGLKITEFLLTDHVADVVMVVSPSEEIEDYVRSCRVDFIKYISQEDVLKRLPEGIDLGVLAWWPHILKSPLIEKPVRGFINTHPSLLPWNRGKHYNFWALVEQAPFGVTLHKVESGIDTGGIIAQKKIPYDWTDTGESLYRKAQNEMVSLFEATWPMLRAGRIEAAAQAAGGSFHVSSEIHEASRLDLDATVRVRDLLNRLRARTFSPHPACWFEEGDERYEVSIKIRKVDS